MTIVIFGGGGDLAHRKLLPALYNLHVDGLLPKAIAIVGVGRKPITDEAYREFAKDGVVKFSRRPIDEAKWQAFAANLFSATADIDGQSSMAPLGARLDVIEHDHSLSGERLYYLALPSSLFVPTVRQLQQSHFVQRGDGAKARIVVEKPIGTDLKSACAINDAIAEVFDEPQIYRIDHYLGKETVQNILVMRFANSFFEPLFNQKYVDHVQITVAEEEGVGTRAGYYEQAGALRDMIQNHMLQLLSLVAMEAPHSLDADVIRDEKLEILQSLRPLQGAAIDSNVVRGQYEGYRHEDGVDPNSRTETFVALQVFIDNWRWYGVPFFLRTGKQLPSRASEISIHLKEIPPILFNADPAKRLEPNIIAIRIQPDEGFSLGISCKKPGPHADIAPVKMDFHYGEMFGVGSSPEAYERLLLDVISGDPTLFMRRDAVETAWRWVMPILDRWTAQSDPLPTYAPGSWGPPEADRLIESMGRKWRPLMRYLVTARVRPERETALDRAIEDESLGRGSVAGDEYLRNMAEARQLEDGRVQWVEVCYCATPLAEERDYWEPFFTLDKVQDAHARSRCRDLNGTEPWACSDCDCTAKLEAHLARKGRPFRP